MIIFDMDGTLWDTTNVTFESAKIISDTYDEVKPVDINTIKNGMGLDIYQCSKLYMPYLDEEKRVFYLKKLIEKTNELISSDSIDILYDGVSSTLRELSKRYKLAIVTNNADSYVETFIKKARLNDVITDYIGTASHNISKTEAIKLIKERNKANDCYYVGDIDKDKEAAREAGVTFIHAKYGFQPDLEADLYINDIKELLQKI